MEAGLGLKYRAVWLFIGYSLLALVVYLSLTGEPPKFQLDFPYQDKFFHVLAYFTLMFWFAQLYHRALQRVVLVAVLVSLGLLMEYVQSFNPHRYAEFADMVANATGVLLAYLATRQRLRFVLMRIEALLF